MTLGHSYENDSRRGVNAHTHSTLDFLFVPNTVWDAETVTLGAPTGRGKEANSFIFSSL